MKKGLLARWKEARKKKKMLLPYSLARKGDTTPLRKGLTKVKYWQKAAKEFERQENFVSAAGQWVNAGELYIQLDHKRYEKKARHAFEQAGRLNILEACRIFFSEEKSAKHPFTRQAIGRAQTDFQRAGLPEKAVALSEVLIGEKSFPEYLEKFEPEALKKFKKK